MEWKILKLDNKFDIYRLLKQGVIGFSASPILHLQYCKIVPYLFPERKKYSFLKTIAYVTLISDTSLNYFFFVGLSVFDGKGLIESIKS